MPQAKSLLDLLRIRAKNWDYIKSIRGNMGTALGFKKETDQPLSDVPAILIFVQQKIKSKWLDKSQVIRSELEGPDDLWAPVDVVEGGKAELPLDTCPAGISPQSCYCHRRIEKHLEVPECKEEYCERLRGWDDKIWVGSQISRLDEDDPRYAVSGTIGAFAKTNSGNDIGLLTNQHVANKPGEKIYFPWPFGKHLATTEKTFTLADDEDWYGSNIDEPDAKVRIDCAFAKLNPRFDRSSLSAEMMDVGKLGQTKSISLDDMSIIGQKVMRLGRTTGLRKGTVTAFGYMYGLDYDPENPGKKYTSYTDLLIAGDNEVPFSTHGDSGSLIVLDNDERNPVGLLWGGWEEKLQNGRAQEKWSWGILLDRVEKELGIKVITDSQDLLEG